VLYNLTDFPRKNFDRLHLLVRRTVDLSRQGSPGHRPTLSMVTDDYTDLPRDLSNLYRMAREDTKAGGSLYYGLSSARGVRAPTPIWISPHSSTDVRRLTIIHELCHAYNLDNAGHSADAHGPRWRRLYGMVLWHYAEMSNGVFDPREFVTKYVVYPYKRPVDGSLYDKEISMICKAARLKHSRVMESF
jgi:hypothetical protein